ncbi:MAG: hypothetical protein KGJ57_17655 [Sphingomonadales bacterium]|nr:hypothetical protein [Sphingomonadales bacterium]MDE2171225.1 hypothetical protein [Sphingomonadales bacterium]
MAEHRFPRNIHVGKSWPRPATPTTLVPNWEGEFRDHADWVNFAHKRLTVAHDSNGSQLKAICVDTLGRRCANGRDMQRAQDEGTFPVRYFFECIEPAPQPIPYATLLASLETAIRTLRDAGEDYEDLLKVCRAAQGEDAKGQWEWWARSLEEDDEPYRNSQPSREAILEWARTEYGPAASIDVIEARLWSDDLEGDEFMPFAETRNHEIIGPQEAKADA